MLGYTNDQQTSWLVSPSAREVFGHIESDKISVILNPTNYMLTSFGFAFIPLRYIRLQIPLKQSVNFLKS